MGGLSSVTWTAVATMWGLVVPMTGTEQIKALQMMSIVTHEVTIRYRTGIVPKMRLVRQEVGGQIFEIHAVISDNFKNTQLTLLCSEVQTQGA